MLFDGLIELLAWVDRVTSDAREAGWEVVDFELEPEIESPEPGQRWSGIAILAEHREGQAKGMIGFPSIMIERISATAKLAEIILARLDAARLKGGELRPSDFVQQASRGPQILMPGQEPRKPGQVIPLLRPGAKHDVSTKPRGPRR